LPIFHHTIYERRCAMSNLLSNDIVLGNPPYIDVTLKLLKRLTEWISDRGTLQGTYREVG